MIAPATDTNCSTSTSPILLLCFAQEATTTDLEGLLLVAGAHLDDAADFDPCSLLRQLLHRLERLSLFKQHLVNYLQDGQGKCSRFSAARLCRHHYVTTTKNERYCLVLDVSRQQPASLGNTLQDLLS
jgi:hypothetical protein